MKSLPIDDVGVSTGGRGNPIGCMELTLIASSLSYADGLGDCRELVLLSDFLRRLEQDNEDSSSPSSV